jgi:hypothetical protein
MKILHQKRANMDAVIGFTIALMIVAIIVAIALYTTDKVADKMTGKAASATVEMIDEVATIPGWIGILVVAFFGVLIIGLFMGMRYIGNNQ